MTKPDNPYVGLRPFESRHSRLFFGRRAQTAELLDELRRERFLAVVGTSGCGKSSLARAGLVPALEAGFLVADRDRWLVAAMKPGSAPLRNLAAALGSKDVEELHRALEDDPVDAVESFLSERLDERMSLLLLVDQFEEIFAFREAEGEERQERTRRRAEADDFVALLLQLARRQELPVYVVLTMRSDFLGDCDVFYGLPEAMNRGRYLVPRLGRQELREAVEGPARLRGAEVAPRLVDLLLNELGDRMDRLPVLQHALLRTWEQWQAGEDDAIDLEHYEAAGTLRRALAEHAAEALADVDRNVAARVFQRLTDTDPHGRRVRRAASFAELVKASGANDGEVEKVLERFQADGRHFLAVSGAERRVEISHESLIRQWRTLQDWVDEERTARDLLRDLVDRTRRNAAGEGALLYGHDLARFQKWRRQARPTAEWARRYRPPEDFLAGKRFLSRSKTRTDFLKSAVAAFGLLLILVTASAQRNAKHAKESAARAEDLVRIAVARESLDKDPTTAALVLLEVKKPDETSFAAPLMQRVSTKRFADVELRGHEGGVNVAAFSPSGDRVVTASYDGTARVWDLSDPENPLVLEGHGSWVLSASFDASGGRVVTASYDGTARVWDLSDPENPLILEGHGDGVRSASFDASGGRVVTASDDGTARVWDLSDPENPLVLEGHGSWVLSASFDASGGRVVTASADGTARVWKVRTEDLRAVLRSSTRVCLEPRFRERSLGESKEEARRLYEECCRSQGYRPVAGD